MLGIVVGSLALTASAQNRSAGERDEFRDAWLYACAGGVLLFIFGCGTLENSWPNEQHHTLFYQIWAAPFPLMLVGHSRVGRLRYPATASAAVFMLMWFTMGQILPLVHATPHLAPIWNARTYLWPPYFPALLIVPAFGIDVVRRRLEGRNPWLVSLALAATFVMLLVLVQWPLSSYLLTDASHNRLFHGQEWPYSSRPDRGSTVSGAPRARPSVSRLSGSCWRGCRRPSRSAPSRAGWDWPGAAGSPGSSDETVVVRPASRCCAWPMSGVPTRFSKAAPGPTRYA